MSQLLMGGVVMVLRGVFDSAPCPPTNVLGVAVYRLIRNYVRARIEGGIGIIVAKVACRQTAVGEIKDIAAYAGRARRIKDRPIWSRIGVQVCVDSTLCGAPLTALPCINSAKLVVPEKVALQPIGALAEERHVINRGNGEAMPVIKH